MELSQTPFGEYGGKKRPFAKFQQRSVLVLFSWTLWFVAGEKTRVPGGDKQPLLLPIFSYLRLKRCQDPTCQPFAHDTEKIKHECLRRGGWGKLERFPHALKCVEIYVVWETQHPFTWHLCHKYLNVVATQRIQIAFYGISYITHKYSSHFSQLQKKPPPGPWRFHNPLKHAIIYKLSTDVPNEE